MQAFVSMVCVCGWVGGQSHRHGVELNYSKLQPPVGQTVWSKAPGIQRPLTINHISITYLAWPKASDMQKYSCQVELLQGLRGYPPRILSRAIMKTIGICRVWVIQVSWVNTLWHNMPQLLAGSMAYSLFQSPLVQTILQEPTGLYLSPTQEWSRVSQFISLLSRLITSQWSNCPTSNAALLGYKGRQITHGHTGACRSTLTVQYSN